MTLMEMSEAYAGSAALIRGRMAELRTAVREQRDDPEAVRALRQRLAELMPLLREMRELTELTRRYYDRSYHKHERYTI